MTDRWLKIFNDPNDRLICQGSGGSFTLEQFRQYINRLQDAIEKKKYATWVLYDTNGFRFICAMFALLSTGRKVMVPASGAQTAIESMLEPDIGFIGSHFDLSKYIDIEVAGDEWDANYGGDARVVSSGGWGQVTFCTSGSLGQPKVITKSAEQLYLEVESFNLKWKPTSRTLFIPLVTHLHIYGLTFGFLLPLLARAGFYLTRNEGLLGVVEPITLDCKKSANQLIVVTSPTVGRQAEKIRVLAEPESVTRKDRPASINQLFCAGGKLTDGNARQIMKLFDCSVTEIFGSTETGAVATRQHNEHHELGNNNPWQLLPGINAHVTKENDKVGNNVNLVGELLVWGGHVGGSKNMPVMTGDQVKFLDCQRFELLGRNSQIYKIEGKRVSLQYLVEVLEGCELIAESAVLPFEKNDKEILLCGVVLSHQGISNYQRFGKRSTDHSIREYLLHFLTPVLIPRTIRYFEQMPCNAMGKIPKQTLIDMLVEPKPVTLPLIEHVVNNEGELMFLLSIPMMLGFLHGHFENRPIVPGVVLLHWVYHFVNEYWKLPINSAVVNRLKFSRPIAPGEKLNLIIKHTVTGIEFLYQNEKKIKCASGQIPLISETTNV